MKLSLFNNLYLYIYFLLSVTSLHLLANPSKIISSQFNADVDSCSQARGVLVLAHGKSNHDHHQLNLSLIRNPFLMSFNLQETPDENEWENTILKMVGEASSQIPFPIEVAFGMWDQKTFQEGTTILANQSVCELVIIPLFISDHSDIIRAQKYQFHLSENNPLPFDPGRVKIPTSIKKVIFKSALNDHHHLSAIIAERAENISQNPNLEELILVAHGPNGEDDDVQWIKDLSTHASRINLPFYNIHVFTLRDDAEKDISDRKTKELQNLVKNSTLANRKPLIVPVLLAPGGIEEGIKERLQGLTYTLSPKMLAPDHHLIEWIIDESLDQTHVLFN